MNPEEIAQEAIRRMNGKITDEIFLIIEDDPNLCKAHSIAIREKGEKAVNPIIGKRVRAAYGLANSGREQNPSSKLIKSYEKH